MATYNEVPVNIANFSGTAATSADNLLYTCPSGRYARAIVGVRNTGGGSGVVSGDGGVSAVIDGQTVRVAGMTSYAGSAVESFPREILLKAGDTLRVVGSNTGGAGVAAAGVAIEYALP